MEFNHRVPNLLDIVYAALIGIFAYLAGSAYYLSLPGEGFDGFRITVYSITALVIAVYAVLKGQAAALHYAVWGLVWGMVVYLFTLRHSPQLLSTYLSLRNLYLTGFVILFVIHGLFSMVFQSKYPANADDFRKNIPHLVLAVIVLVFSYSIILLVSQVI